MRFLVTNDDGISAPGIAALVKELSKHGEVLVAAPDHNCSANSHHLTMHDPIPVREQAFPGTARAWAVGGTPADCVHLAVSTLLQQPVDLVVSGINRGANLATDCLYSGTVAAAVDGWILGLPGLAVSLCSYDAGADYTYAARVAAAAARYIVESGRTMVLNVNVPPLPQDGIRGVKLSAIDRRIVYSDDCYAVQNGSDPEQKIYQFVPYDCDTNQPSADLAAVLDGYVSVTPLTGYWSDAALLQELAPDFSGGIFRLPE
ncbi:MAG: 5'/3'-nucleotidase SurE [Oscillospiraceae bacterium]|nr:5'/3'-nucleotidase SurE [Oscillospiraceae bacterium]